MLQSERKRFPLFRPPAEGNSLILQVAYGCPHNSCAFCGMYKQVPYQERSLADICNDISALTSDELNSQRLFLADGDGLAIATAKLVAILKRINGKMGALARVGVYANSRSVLSKSDEELSALKKLKLSTVYTGIESGSPAVLKRLNKQDTPEEAIAAAKKLAKAGIKLSVMVLLGAGGREQSEEHACKSAEVLNGMQPPLLSLLSMTPVPGTKLFGWVEQGSFSLLTRRQNVQEIRGLVERLELTSTIFRCNHSSNAWPLEGRFPKDKARLLSEIDFILEQLKGPDGDEVEVVPAWAL